MGLVDEEKKKKEKKKVKIEETVNFYQFRYSPLFSSSIGYHSIFTC